MVYHVISTKLTDEEHKILLNICHKHDCTPFQFIKESVKRSINEIVNAEKTTSLNVKSQKRPKKQKSPKLQKKNLIPQNEGHEQEIKIIEEYSKIKDVQVLIKIYADLREKQNLSDNDINKLTILHNLINEKIGK